jgi:hypothetical protein
MEHSSQQQLLALLIIVHAQDDQGSPTLHIFSIKASVCATGWDIDAGEEPVA